MLVGFDFFVAIYPRRSRKGRQTQTWESEGPQRADPPARTPASACRLKIMPPGEVRLPGHQLRHYTSTHIIYDIHCAFAKVNHGSKTTDCYCQFLRKISRNKNQREDNTQFLVYIWFKVDSQCNIKNMKFYGNFNNIFCDFIFVR